MRLPLFIPGLAVLVLFSPIHVAASAFASADATAGTATATAVASDDTIAIQPIMMHCHHVVLNLDGTTTACATTVASADNGSNLAEATGDASSGSARATATAEANASSTTVAQTSTAQQPVKATTKSDTQPTKPASSTSNQTAPASATTQTTTQIASNLPGAVTQALQPSSNPTISSQTIKKLGGFLVAIILLLVLNVFLLIWLLFVSLRGPRIVQRF